MGKSNSKETFTQWDLDRFSNVTGVPKATVEKLYQEFAVSSGKDNKMDKKEFRRLYKELYTSGHTGSTLPAALSEHDLEKMSDRVFKAFDADGSGKLTFEEFVNAYTLIGQSSTSSKVLPRDRFNYVLDHNNPTPGYISRDQGEQVFNRLNRYYNWDDATKSTTTTTTPGGHSKPVSTTWEQHWSKLDDGSGRVPQEKFVEYVTTSDDYKRHIHRSLV